MKKTKWTLVLALIYFLQFVDNVISTAIQLIH